MVNGFEINISEADFKAKSKDDQAWILFQGVVIANRGINDLDKNGCQFSRNRHRYNLIKTLSAISGSIVFAIGAIYIIYQMVCIK
jgi:hypothetical protein